MYVVSFAVHRGVVGVHELIRLVEDPIILICDIQIEYVIIQNTVYELAFTAGINSFLVFVDNRSRGFLLLLYSGRTDFSSLLNGPLLDSVI